MASCPKMMFKLTLNQLRLFADFRYFLLKGLDAQQHLFQVMARLKYILERWERRKREKKMSQPLLFREGAVRGCFIAETTFVIRPLTGIVINILSYPL